MDITGIGAVATTVGSIINKIFPDAADRDKANLALLELQQNGELKKIEGQLGAIIAEAKSSDPWTSRARPSFMYVFYALILSAIPMGILHALRPDLAVAISAGFKAWLEAMPEQLWYLFGVGYLGYTGARSYEKKGGKA